MQRFMDDIYFYTCFFILMLEQQISDNMAYIARNGVYY